MRAKRKQRRTPKQLKALKLVREQVISGKNLNVGKAMREAQYAETTSLQPNKITKLPEFQEIIAQYLPDEHVSMRHRELLDKRETEIVYDFVKNGKKLIKTPRLFDKGPDTQAVKAGVDMAYKIKNRYPNPSIAIGVQVNMKEDTKEYTK